MLLLLEEVIVAITNELPMWQKNETMTYSNWFQ